MKHLLLATTALAAVSVSLPALADVSVGGYTAFTYDSGSGADEYSPDFNVWVRAEETTDTNLTYGGAARFTPDDASRHYLYLRNDLGKLTLGKHHGPAYTMSLGSDWRGTVSAAGKATTPIFQGHTTPRIIYTSPNVSGFQAGVSVSAGSEDLGAETQTGLNYTMHLNESMIRLAHNRSSVHAVGGSPFGSEATETGIEFTHGKFMASFVTFDKTEALQGVMSSGTTTEMYYQEISNLPKGAVRFTNEDLKAAVRQCGRVRAHMNYRSLRSLKDCPSGDDVHFAEGQVSLAGGDLRQFDKADNEYYRLPSGEIVDKADYATFEERSMEVPTTSYSEYSQQTTSGQEIELAYFFNDDMTVNLVKYSDNHDYDRLSFGVKYTFAPNITASLSHSSIDNAGVDEDAMRLRLNYSF